MTVSPFVLIAVSDMSECLDVYDSFINDLEENIIYFRIGICYLFKDQKY